MKFTLTFLLLFLCSLPSLEAQGIKTEPPSFLLKGKVKNNKQRSWSLEITNYFRNETVTIPIQKDGTFTQNIRVEGMQDVYLILNDDPITLYVQPGDSIEVNWDENNFEKSFAIKSTKVAKRQARNEELQLNWKLYKAFRTASLSLYDKLYEQSDQADSVKSRWINELYNQELTMILSDTSALTFATDKFVYQTYYKYSYFLFKHKLLASFPLTTNEALVNPHGNALVKGFIPSLLQYKMESDKAFYECPEYRTFLFDCIRLPNPVITGSSITDTYSNEKEDVASSLPAWDAYYQGLVGLHIIPIREWYITKSIMFSFKYYSFQESEEVMQDFLPKCKTQPYKDTLANFYASVQHLQPGSKAPDFTLKDEKGQTVSLSDFKGKLVYLDFWGISCPPCMYDIKNYVPQLHARYHGKDVVFINICVGENEKSWKKFLSKTKLDGVNLLAEGARWPENKVCKDYRIDAIPHYILIDRQGKIVTPNAKRPFEMGLDAKYDEIEKLLGMP